MKIKCGSIIPCLSILLVSTNPQAGELAIETNFPGGSGVVDSVDQQKRILRISPTPHKDKGWASWWYVKITGITPGEKFTLDVGPYPWATPDQATVSSDGKIWEHTTPGIRKDKRISYTLKSDQSELWVAWGPPFLPGDAQKLVNETADKYPFATSFNLCNTREGNPTPALRISAGKEDDPNRIGIWFQARQHAWESGSSWVAKGLVDWLVSDDPAARELRQRALIHVVPIMDIDNVLRGAGGKSQKPQDHNRDWTEKPHWRAVYAAQQAILKQDHEKQFDLFVDLHNPGINDKSPYYYVPPKDSLTATGQRNHALFIQASREKITGPLAFLGKTIESGKSYDPKAWTAISKNWVTKNCRDHVVAVTLETSWNTANSTSEGYQQVGRELGEAVAVFFRK